MPKLRNGNNVDSNPGSLDCESGILPTELPRSTPVMHGSKRRTHFKNNGSDFCVVIFENTAQLKITVSACHFVNRSTLGRVYISICATIYLEHCPRGES